MFTRRSAATLAILLSLVPCVPLHAQDVAPGRIRGAVVAELPAGLPINLYLGKSHGDLILGRYSHTMQLPKAGPFVIDQTPAGSYVIAAFVDLNGNGTPERELEPYAVRREPVKVLPGEDTEPLVLDRWFNTEPRAMLTPQMRRAFAEQLQGIYTYLAPRAIEPDLTPVMQRRMQTLLLRLRNVGAWIQRPGTPAELQWLAEELSDISRTLEQLEGGTDPAAQDRGAVRRAVRSEQHNAPWPYALYIPHEYDEGRAYPLFVVLHGAGGNPDGMLITACGAGEWGRSTLQGRGPFPEFPSREAFVVAPYAPTGHEPYDGYRPYQQEVLDTIDAVLDDFNIDTGRVFLTGFSMGGGGTWRIGLTYPERFAALGPIAATLPLPVAQAGSAPELPVVVFHGEFDHITSISEIRRYAQARSDTGGTVDVQEFAGQGHYLDLFGMDEVFTALEHARRTR